MAPSPPGRLREGEGSKSHSREGGNPGRSGYVATRCASGSWSSVNRWRFAGKPAVTVRRTHRNPSFLGTLRRRWGTGVNSGSGNVRIAGTLTYEIDDAMMNGTLTPGPSPRGRGEKAAFPRRPAATVRRAGMNRAATAGVGGWRNRSGKPTKVGATGGGDTGGGGTRGGGTGGGGTGGSATGEGPLRDDRP